MQTYSQNSASGHISRHNPSLALWRPSLYSEGYKDSQSMSATRISRQAAIVFGSALLLVRHEDHAVIDRQSLRRLGMRNIRIMTSGVEVANILTGRSRLNDGFPAPDIVFCDETLGDMSGHDFVKLLRTHPILKKFPVIMMARHDSPSLRQQEKKFDYSGVLIRPYSGDTLHNQLVKASNIHPPLEINSEEKIDSGDFDRSLACFRVTQKISEQAAADCFREGLMALKQERWDVAVSAFQAALKEQSEHPDAIKGLTVALRKKQDQSKAQPAKMSLSNDQAELLKEKLLLAAKSSNPEQAMQSAVFDVLDQASTQRTRALALQFEEKSVYSSSGSGGRFFADDAKNSVIEALPVIHEPDSSEMLSKFPLLRDAVNVAKVTLGLYKVKKK